MPRRKKTSVIKKTPSEFLIDKTAYRDSSSQNSQKKAVPQEVIDVPAEIDKAHEAVQEAEQTLGALAHNSNLAIPADQRELLMQARASLSAVAQSLFQSKMHIASIMPKILKTVEEILDDVDPRNRIAAARFLKEWGLGKPIQVSQVNIRAPSSIIIKDTSMNYE